MCILSAALYFTAARVFVFRVVCVGERKKNRVLALLAFCGVYYSLVMGKIFSCKLCLQPHQGSIWHYANSSTIFSLCRLLLCLNMHFPFHSSVSLLTVPPTVARFALIELHSLSNLLKSVLAVTSTIEVVGREALKKNDTL